MSEEIRVAAHGRSHRRSRHLALKLILVGAFACLMALGVRLVVREDLFRVSVAPGTVAWVDVEVPMRRGGRHESFAKEPGLRVRCSVSDPGGEDHVRLAVVETGHTVHRMRAKLRVEAASWASPGTRTRFVEFTIDGEGGWPVARVLIDVEG